MSTYRYDKYIAWNTTEFYAIDKKTFFGWRRIKTWNLGYAGTYSDIEEEIIKGEVDEVVNRLIQAGNIVF